MQLLWHGPRVSSSQLLSTFRSAKRRTISSFSLCICLLAILLPRRVDAQEVVPLRQQIDRIMQATWGVESIPVASDEEFIRRVYLDLVGQIPPVNEVRDFIANIEPNKREQLVDRLLDDPRHARTLATWFDIAALERRNQVHVEQPLWFKFLTDSFAQDKPLDQLTIELLTADGTEEQGRAQAKFLLEREVDPHVLTRDVGRVFLGVDLQCAQCHDHPHIDSYAQADYYGIYASLLRSGPIKIGEKTLVAEKADGGFEFTSAFTGDKGSAEMRLPDGWPILDSPVPTDAPYVVAPADGVRHVPRWSRRAGFAEAMVHSPDRMFARNWANRLWAMMFGRGIVHPPDLHHSENPPTHPELLEVLTENFRSGQFHVRDFLREVTLSRTYQRPFDLRSSLAIDSAASPQFVTVDAALLTQLEEQELASRSQRSFAMRELVAANHARLEKVGALLALRGQIDAAKAKIVALEASLGPAQEQAAQWQHLHERLSAALPLLGVAPADSPLAIYEARLNAANQVVAGMMTELETNRTAMATLEPQIPSLEEPAAASEAALVQAQANFDQAWKVWTEIKNQLVQQQSLSLVAARSVERKTIAAETQPLVALVAQSQQQLSALQTQEQTLAASHGVAAQEVAQLQEQLTAQTAQLTASTQAMTTAEQTSTQQSALAAELQASLVAINQASTALPSDAETLATLTQSLTTRQQVAASEALAAQTAMAEHQAVVTSTTTEVTAIETKLATAQQSLATIVAQLSPVREQIASIEASLATQTAQLSEKETAWLEIAEAQGLVAGLTPLTPEQLAWSIMQATGVLQNHIDASRNELNTQTPPTAEQAADPAWLAQREREALVSALDKLQGSVNVFINLFGNGAAQPQDGFFATADQSLFFANGGTLQSWIASGGASVKQRCLALSDNGAIADELALTLFGRKATEAEVQWIAASLPQAPEARPAALDEIIWAWMTSVEFRFDR